jgi:serine/threonine protein phosphatase 1
MNIYERIDGSAYRNVWVVGDLHGCYTILMNKLDEIRFDTTQDLLISVGDLIDRGKENIECLDLINFPWFKAVRGNHEQMMIDAVLHNGSAMHWMSNGGDWFYYLDADHNQQAKNLIRKADDLPLVIDLQVGSKRVVICHADYPANDYSFGRLIDPALVIWNRERVSNAWDGVGSLITGADEFIFGHTPAKKPLKYWNQNYIDTGAVFCGNLTLRQLQGEA